MELNIIMIFYVYTMIFLLLSNIYDHHVQHWNDTEFRKINSKRIISILSNNTVQRNSIKEKCIKCHEYSI